MTVEGGATLTTQPSAPTRRGPRGVLASTEIDLRLFGMVVALIVIWGGFHLLSGGDFLTARNLWNLSVQSASIAIMATGMVLIIVSRNIDLSVRVAAGVRRLHDGDAPDGVDPEHLGTSVRPLVHVAGRLAVGLLLGAAIGGRPGLRHRLRRRASFIVTLGGLLVWRGLIFRYQQADPGPARRHLPCSVAVRRGRCASGAAGCSGRSPVPASLQHQSAPAAAPRYRFQVRPLGVDIGLGVLGGLVVPAHLGRHRYPWRSSWPAPGGRAGREWPAGAWRSPRALLPGRHHPRRHIS